MGLPLSRGRQRIEKLLEDRGCHLHAGLELLHPDSLPPQIAPVPSEQSTGLETLSREHEVVEEDTDLCLVCQPGNRVIESPQEFLLLLTSEGIPVHCAARQQRPHAPTVAGTAIWPFEGYSPKHHQRHKTGQISHHRPSLTSWVGCYAAS